LASAAQPGTPWAAYRVGKDQIKGSPRYGILVRLKDRNGSNPEVEAMRRARLKCNRKLPKAERPPVVMESWQRKHNIAATVEREEVEDRERIAVRRERLSH
jgi:hypothetical protein